MYPVCVAWSEAHWSCAAFRQRWMDLNLFSMLILRARFNQLHSRGWDKIEQLTGWLPNAATSNKTATLVAPPKRIDTWIGWRITRSGKAGWICLCNISVGTLCHLAREDKFLQTNQVWGQTLIEQKKVQNMHMHATTVCGNICLFSISMSIQAAWWDIKKAADVKKGPAVLWSD